MKIKVFCHIAAGLGLVAQGIPIELAQTGVEFGALAKLGAAAAGGKGGGGATDAEVAKKANQNAPNLNIVDNNRVMIPEGADPTAVSQIIGKIMDNGIGGIKGGMALLREIGGESGLLGLKIPERFQAQIAAEVDDGIELS